jgi:PEP-CTERM motif-containing protein
MIIRTLATIGAFSCCVFFSTERAAASVTGSLLLDGGSVTVSATSLNWNGPATVNPFTTLTYDSGTALATGPTSTVDLENLPPSSLPLSDFMTFTLAPTLIFDLTTIGPGSSNTNCAAPPCSAFPGSPIILSQGSEGTVVDLGLSGIATDGTSPESTWIGEFSETITSLPGDSGVITPLEVQDYFGGPFTPNSVTITSTYSGTFVATLESTVPEPSTLTMALMGAGLMLIAVNRRKRSDP